jgi:hypothetical protein
VIGNPGDTIPTHYLLVSVAFMEGMVFPSRFRFFVAKIIAIQNDRDCYRQNG